MKPSLFDSAEQKEEWCKAIRNKNDMPSISTEQLEINQKKISKSFNGFLKELDAHNRD